MESIGVPFICAHHRPAKSNHPSGD
uniref:Uncharacterized protein n=1 Tax=Arundo donax TaxID=35708 RepID=A0A0A9FRQ6_ARUDO